MNAVINRCAEVVCHSLPAHPVDIVRDALLHQVGQARRIEFAGVADHSGSGVRHSLDSLLAGADWLFKSALVTYRQTGPVSSGATRNSGRKVAQISEAQPSPSLAKGPFPLLLFVTLSVSLFSRLPSYPFPVNGVTRLTYFNI